MSGKSTTPPLMADLGEGFADVSMYIHPASAELGRLYNLEDAVFIRPPRGRLSTQQVGHLLAGKALLCWGYYGRGFPRDEDPVITIVVMAPHPELEG